MCPQLRASNMHPIGISGTIMSEMHSRLHMRRAVRAIPPGEEVTISYTDLKATRPERRAFLLRHYHFDVDAGTAAAAEQQPADVHLSSQAPGIAASVSRQPPGPLDAVDQQLTALRTPGAVRNPLLSESTRLRMPDAMCSAARSGPAADGSADARCQQQCKSGSAGSLESIGRHECQGQRSAKLELLEITICLEMLPFSPWHTVSLQHLFVQAPSCCRRLFRPMATARQASASQVQLGQCQPGGLQHGCCARCNSNSDMLPGGGCDNAGHCVAPEALRHLEDHGR